MNTKLTWYLILCLIAGAALNACSLLSPIPIAHIHTYTLNTIATPIPHHKTRAHTLLVMTTSNSLYATTQMAYTLYPHQIAYFAVNQWAATPANMLLTLLVQTLQQTHAFHAVVNSPYTGQYDEMLNVEILELLQDFTSPASPCLHFLLRATLTTAAGKVIATKQFSITQAIYPQAPYGGVVAANRALPILLDQIALFSINH